jgi:hypothetical protein
MKICWAQMVATVIRLARQRMAVEFRGGSG